MNYYQCKYCGRLFKSEGTPDIPHNCKDGFRKRNQMYIKLIILDLPLKAEWYDMIVSGEKKEEYREMKPYWTRRLCHTKGKCDWGGYCKMSPVCGKTKYIKSNYTHVRFRYGYTRRTMLFKLDRISVGVGRKEWGAPNIEVYVLKLGERIE